MHFLGINWVGVTEQNGRKLLLSVSFLVAVFLLRAVLHLIARLALRGEGGDLRQYAYESMQTTGGDQAAAPVSL